MTVPEMIAAALGRGEFTHVSAELRKPPGRPLIALLRSVKRQCPRQACTALTCAAKGRIAFPWTSVFLDFITPTRFSKARREDHDERVHLGDRVGRWILKIVAAAGPRCRASTIGSGEMAGPIPSAGTGAD